MAAGKLILLPNVLDESQTPSGYVEIDGLIAESEKSARRYLRTFVSHEELTKFPIRLLNEHTEQKEIAPLLEPILQGQTWGLISDAGVPCIADPGSEIVKLAHQHKIAVDAVPGPCSIILALQLSGFSGQNFCFHGYLPREEHLLIKKIKDLEAKARGCSQIWIEAPYRSSKMLEALKKELQPTTELCVAVNLTGPLQQVISQSIKEWKSSSVQLGKEPAVFLIFS